MEKKKISEDASSEEWEHEIKITKERQKAFPEWHWASTAASRRPE